MKHIILKIFMNNLCNNAFKEVYTSKNHLLTPCYYDVKNSILIRPLGLEILEAPYFLGIREESIAAREVKS